MWCFLLPRWVITRHPGNQLEPITIESKQQQHRVRALENWLKCLTKKGKNFNEKNSAAKQKHLIEYSTRTPWNERDDRRVASGRAGEKEERVDLKKEGPTTLTTRQSMDTIELPNAIISTNTTHPAVSPLVWAGFGCYRSCCWLPVERMNAGWLVGVTIHPLIPIRIHMMPKGTRTIECTYRTKHDCFVDNKSLLCIKQRQLLITQRPLNRTDKLFNPLSAHGCNMQLYWQKYITVPLCLIKILWLHLTFYSVIVQKITLFRKWRWNTNKIRS